MMLSAAFLYARWSAGHAYGPNRGQSAAEWLQTAEEADIARVLKTYGEERFAKRIARAIVERNREQPMTRTKELAEVVAAATPVKDKFKHPATRTFRAVRIWVNSELEEIEQALKARSTCWPGAAFDHQLPLAGRPYCETFYA